MSRPTVRGRVDSRSRCRPVPSGGGARTATGGLSWPSPTPVTAVKMGAMQVAIPLAVILAAACAPTTSGSAIAEVSTAPCSADEPCTFEALALLEGVLSDAAGLRDGCAWVDDGGARTAIVLVEEYQLVSRPSVTIVQAGHVVAEAGDNVAITGGFFPVAEPCARNVHVFVGNDVVRR